MQLFNKILDESPDICLLKAFNKLSVFNLIKDIRQKLSSGTQDGLDRRKPLDKLKNTFLQKLSDLPICRSHIEDQR